MILCPPRNTAVSLKPAHKEFDWCQVQLVRKIRRYCHCLHKKDWESVTITHWIAESAKPNSFAANSPVDVFVASSARPMPW
jgi:hypothetical protein